MRIRADTLGSLGTLNSPLGLDLRVLGTLETHRRIARQHAIQALARTRQRACHCAAPFGTDAAAVSQNMTPAPAPDTHNHANHGNNSGPHVDICDVVSLSTQHTLHAALKVLQEAVQSLPIQYANSPSGLVRLEVPVPRTVAALWWLRGQTNASHVSPLLHPKVFFSPRRSSAAETEGSTAANAAGAGAGSVSGVGAAWMWKGAPNQALDEASMAKMQRFLGADNPRVRVFGGTRFDPASSPSSEWEEFGSYYFVLPRVEYSEASGCGILSCTVAWDKTHSPEDPLCCGFASLDAAVLDAAAALGAIQPPAPPAAGALRITPGAPRHLPNEEEWGQRLETIHKSLHPAVLDSIEGPPTGDSLLKIDPNAALDEYMRNGQQGLDDLLAALDSGFSAVVASSSSSSSDSDGDMRIKSPKALTKVVLARRTDLEISGELDPLALLEALQERDPRAYQVLLQLPSGATFLSSTPECLYTRSGRAVASEAVAGTRARGAGGDVERDFWLAFDLLQSQKDDVEFGVVRDWVRRTLGALCDDVKLEVAKSVLKQGSVQHLYAKLAGTLHPEAGDAALLAALHPTPAVCGQPRVDALRELSQVEPFDRGFYAGPFGWIAHDAAEFVVAIRSALVRPGNSVSSVQNGATFPSQASVSLYAGVGIVSGSDTASEWAELNLKIQQFQRLLAPAPALAHAPNLPALWANIMVEELCRLGCNTFCVAPGSRSSPLTTAIAQHPRARIVPCIDERSLGFWALGYGRARGRPAVVVTSSGTAVANLLPAVVEASQSNVPMLLLTADRPEELRGTGANQTINQVNIFGSYVRWECDMEAPGEDDSDTEWTPGSTQDAMYPLKTIGQAVRSACDVHAGPVHVNCQFREPLAPASAPWDPKRITHTEEWEYSGKPLVHTKSAAAVETDGGNGMILHHQTPSNSVNNTDSMAVHEVLSTLKHARRGLIVVGEQISPEESAAIVQLAQHVGWPVAADVLSGLRIGARDSRGNNSLALISHFDHLLLSREHWDTIQPDVVLQLGGHITSKRTIQFLEWCAETQDDGSGVNHVTSQWIFVDKTPLINDQGPKVTSRLACSISTLLGSMLSIQNGTTTPHQVAHQEVTSYCKALLALDATVAAAIDATLESFSELTEPQIARMLSQELPPGEGLFIGNSMPIRDLDMYATPKKGVLSGQGSVGSGVGVAVGANRGASGIDGVLSTAAGFAAGLSRGCTLLVGDVSFLHDINGLNLLRNGEMRPPLTVLLVNNGGGSIFSFLPIADHLPEDIFTPLWTTPQNVDLAGMCRAHSIPHIKVFTAEELHTALHSAWGLNRHSVVEVVTDRHTNVARHREIQAAVQGAVETSFSESKAFHFQQLGGDPSPVLTVDKATWETYRAKFDRPLTTSAPKVEEYRRGIILNLTLTQEGGRGCVHCSGEASPLPGLHKETLEDVMVQVAALCEMLCGVSIPINAAERRHGGLERWMHCVGIDVDALLPSVRFALEGAILNGIATAQEKSIAAVLCDGQEGVATLASLVAVNALFDPGAEVKGFDPEYLRNGINRDRCIKVKVGRDKTPQGHLNDAATLSTIRKAVGPSVGLRCDANRGWSLEHAVAFGLAVADLGLEYVEEPLKTPTPEALEEFYKRTGVPTALDESIDEGLYLNTGVDGADAEERLPEGVAAVVLKPSLLGGFERCIQLSNRARTLGATPIISSSFESPLGLAQLAHLAAAVDPTGASYHGLGTDTWVDWGADQAGARSESNKITEYVAGTGMSIVLQHNGGGNAFKSPVFYRVCCTDPTSDPAPYTELMHRTESLETHSTHVLCEYLEINPLESASKKPLYPNGSTSKDDSDTIPTVTAAPPVLFLHGMFGSAHEWVPYMRSFAASGRRCISVHLPGHGKTVSTHRYGSAYANNEDEEEEKLSMPLSIENTVEALHEFIQRVDAQGCTVVGYSLGARLAMQLSIKYKDSVGKVIAIGGHPGIDSLEARCARCAADDALAAELQKRGIESFLRQQWYTAPMWASFRQYPTFEDVVERRIAALKGHEGELADVLMQASPGRMDSMWDSLNPLFSDSMHKALVILVGEKDGKFVGVAKEVAEKVEGAVVEVVAGAGHAVHIERPLHVLSLLRRHI